MPALDAIDRKRVRHRPSIREERAITVTFDPDRYTDTTRAQWEKAAAAWHAWGPTLEDWLSEATTLMLDAAGVTTGSTMLAIGGICEEWIMRGVELNVFAAEPHELVDLLAKDFPCQSPHRNASRSQSLKPSTASVNWL